MSLARIYHTKRSQKDLTCEKCRQPIPKGTPYLYFYVGFRSKYKHTRHDSCAPRNSERESSMKSGAYAAIEAAEDSLRALDPETAEASEVEEIVSEAASALQETIDQYREADESWGGGGYTQSAEIADEIEASQQDLEGWSADTSCEPDPDDPAYHCEEHGEDVVGDEDNQISADMIEQARMDCPACQRLFLDDRVEWMNGVISDAEDTLGGVSF